MGGFHTKLMSSAKERMDKALDEVLPRMKPPRCAVYMNVTGKPIMPGASPKEIVQLMKLQLVNKVHWEQSMKAMVSSGITEYLEVGPMKQLRSTLKRIDPKAWSSSGSVEV